MMWLPEVKKSVMIRLAVSTQYRRVTDRRTDILRQHSARYAHYCTVKTILGHLRA